MSYTRSPRVSRFISIRQFTLATERLMDKIMLFVNLIGEIVHGLVNEYHGCPNKNTGSGFLVLWRCNRPGEKSRRVLALAESRSVQLLFS